MTGSYVQGREQQHDNDMAPKLSFSWSKYISQRLVNSAVSSRVRVEYQVELRIRLWRIQD
jgi:hypothetical protein